MTDSAVDVDVYLDCGVFFELYGVLCYPDLDSEPLAGTATIDAHLAALVSQGIMLIDIAVDDEDSLVLILAKPIPGDPLSQCRRLDPGRMGRTAGYCPFNLGVALLRFRRRPISQYVLYCAIGILHLIYPAGEQNQCFR